MIFTAEQYAAFANVNIPRAVTQLQAFKTQFIAGHIGKQTRPWFVIDFPSLHPSDATLIGFEIETGFQLAEHRNSFMNWLWDNTDYTTVDREGCSSCPTEITFPPMTFELLTSDDSPIKAMFDYNSSITDESARMQTTRVTSSNDNGSCVGTHTNISTAAYRALTPNQRANVSSFIRNFFSRLNLAQRYAIQGRAPYTEGVCNARGGTGDGANRIEFKMFHTTTDQVQFNNYLKVSKRLAELIDAQCGSPNRSVLGDTTQVFAFLTQDLESGSVIAPTNRQYTAPIITSAAEAGRVARSSYPGVLSLAA